MRMKVLENLLTLIGTIKKQILFKWEREDVCIAVFSDVLKRQSNGL